MIYRLLREAARLREEGKAKSNRNALLKVSEDDSQYETLKKKWVHIKDILLCGARRARKIEMELENNGGGQAKITSFDRSWAWKAPIGTYALINQGSTDWDLACRAGWYEVERPGNPQHGEVLICRKAHGFMSEAEFVSSEPIQRWCREMAILFGEDQ